ncbi:MAG: hypothetical protein WCM76_15990 [Bacteroidota bacterium]
MRTFYFSVIVLLCSVSTHLYGQGTAVNTTGASADNSAMLDISAANKGVLIPRIALTDTIDATTIPLPSTSLMVYNTNVGGGLVKGYYYNSGTSVSPRWTQFFPNPANTELNMSNFKITNLATCTNNPDAANKAYVDAQIALVGGSGGSTVPVMISDESTSSMNFRMACDYCRTLTEGGFTDWRIPSYYDMWTVVSNTIYPIPSSTSSSWLWLMDRDTNYGYNHMMANMATGDMSYCSGSSSNKVRCVR